MNPGALGCSPEPVARFVVVEVESGGDTRFRFTVHRTTPIPLFRALDDRRVPARDFIRRTFLPIDDGPLTA